MENYSSWRPWDHLQLLIFTTVSQATPIHNNNHEQPAHPHHCWRNHSTRNRTFYQMWQSETHPFINWTVVADNSRELWPSIGEYSSVEFVAAWIVNSSQDLNILMWQNSYIIICLAAPSLIVSYSLPCRFTWLTKADLGVSFNSLTWSSLRREGWISTRWSDMTEEASWETCAWMVGGPEGRGCIDNHAHNLQAPPRSRPQQLANHVEMPKNGVYFRRRYGASAERKIL